MRIGIIGSPNGWYWNDLERAARESTAEKIDLVPLPFTSLSARLDHDQQSIVSHGHALDTLDGVLVRSMPPGSLEQVIFRMDVLHALLEQGCLVINRPRALETAIDKYLCLVRLRAAGLNVPLTVVTQEEDEALQAFDRLGGDVVVKPIFGSEGRGLIRLTDREIARRVFRALHQVQSVHYIQQYIANEGYDLRLLVIGDRVVGMRRICQNDWRANLAQGARAEALIVDGTLAQDAIMAARAIDADVAAIDFLPGTNGRLYALEVNAVPGWRGLAKTLQVDIAAMILEYLRRLVDERSSNQPIHADRHFVVSPADRRPAQLVPPVW